ncbi:MAG: calcium-binding protein [Pseudomonadota bacterium]
MINLTASRHGFHLLNEADQKLSPYALLSSAVNATGRMVSEDGKTWTWDLPSADAPYAIMAMSSGDGATREISEIKFYRLDRDDQIEIGVMDLNPPLSITVTEPASADELWSTELALPFRLALKDHGFSVTGGRAEDYINLNNPTTQLHEGMVVHGRAGDDHIIGGLGDDVIKGGRGDDIISDASGDNILKGGAGDDIITVSDPSGTSKLIGGKGDDMLISGAGDDILRGGKGDDVLEAGAGDDRLIGGAGNDQLIAGLGRDRMTGGSGQDQFVINTGLDGKKTVTDFDVDQDTLLLLNFSGDREDVTLTQKGKHVIISDPNESFTLMLKNTNVDDLADADIDLM